MNNPSDKGFRLKGIEIHKTKLEPEVRRKLANPDNFDDWAKRIAEHSALCRAKIKHALLDGEIDDKYRQDKLKHVQQPEWVQALAQQTLWLERSLNQDYKVWSASSLAEAITISCLRQEGHLKLTKDLSNICQPYETRRYAYLDGIFRTLLTNTVTYLDDEGMLIQERFQRVSLSSTSCRDNKKLHIIQAPK